MLDRGGTGSILDKGSLLRFTFFACTLIKKHSPRFSGTMLGPDYLGGHFWSSPTLAGTLQRPRPLVFNHSGLAQMPLE
jgi:hypothetical protein